MNAMDQGLAAEATNESWGPLLGFAAHEVFEHMLGSRLSPASGEISGEELNITSMVGLAGRLCGVITVRCGDRSARVMASKMLGVDPDQAGPEMWDAVGEVCNMIAGNFKNKIAGLGDRCMLSVPTVITGADYNLHAVEDALHTEVRFLFEGMPLLISLEIHR